jgi:hypothetical protein
MGRFHSCAQQGGCRLALLAVLLLFADGASFARDLKILPSSVEAYYRIDFTVLGNIGKFHFRSDLADGRYTLNADAKVSATVFSYKAQMTSAGTLKGDSVLPAAHSYGYKQKAMLGKKKQRTTSITFNAAGVSAVTFVPPDAPSSRAVPVLPTHLNDVLDPLSAVMSLSLGNLAKPCDRRLAIYDGKQRFDVVFTPLRRAGSDHVCRVRLIPISGHKPGEGPASVVTGTIELVMRPVTKANVVIPLRVTVPTTVGTAVLGAEQIAITMPNQPRYMLSGL